MKTAISIPEDTFAQVEERASVLGISRSEFFTRAARAFLEQLEVESLRRQVDAALELGGADDSGAAAVAAGRRRLQDADGDW